jgi:hypothetical protein
MASDLAAAVTQGRDPERALDAWMTCIACEIAAKAHADGSAGQSRHRPLKDLLPEIA